MLGSSSSRQQFLFCGVPEQEKVSMQYKRVDHRARVKSVMYSRRAAYEQSNAVEGSAEERETTRLVYVYVDFRVWL